MFNLILCDSCCENVSIKSMFFCCRRNKKRNKKAKTIICKKIEGEVIIERMFTKDMVASGLTILFNANNEILSVSGQSVLIPVDKLKGKNIHELDKYIHLDLLYIIDDILLKTKQFKQTFGVLVKVISSDDSVSQFIVATFPVVQNKNSIVYSIVLMKQPYTTACIDTGDIITAI